MACDGRRFGAWPTMGRYRSHMGDPEEAARRSGSRWAVGVVVGLTLLVGGCVVLTSRGGDGGPGSGDAWVNCKAAVKDQLQNPGTADFSLLGSTITEVGDHGGWRVVGPVKAKNDFGAEQELAFTCVTTPLGRVLRVNVE